MMKAKEIIEKLYKDYTIKHWKKIATSLMLSILVAGSTSSIAWLLDPAIKKLFIEKELGFIFLIPLAIIIAFAVKGSSLYLARMLMIRVSEEIMKDVRLDLLKSIFKSDTQELENKHSGKYLSHIQFDVSNLTNLASNALLNVMKDGLTLFALMGLMFYQNWKLASFALIMIPFASIVAKSLGKRMGKITTQAQEVYADVTSYLSEVFKNYKIIKIYQKENFENERAKVLINKLKEKCIKSASVLIRSAPIMEFLTGIMIAGLIYYSAVLVNKGELEINNFFSFLAAMMLAYQPVRSLATLNIAINQGLAAARRIFPIINQKNKIENDPNLPNLKIDNGRIKFNNVNFSYQSKSEIVLKSVSIDIKGGETVALVGHSGAGKSTIMNLIPRFYDPESGTIEIDNQSIYKVNLDSLRKNISFVSQEITLFDDTVESNIAYAGSNPSKEKILEACKYSFAHEFIEKLPEKYNTKIGENGVKLSGGEKQRLSIARAILKDSPIILLDEATSSLDADIEHKIQEAIIYLTKGKTTVIIAHRLSTIFKADRIFVVDKGKIVAEGKHDVLLKNSEIYKNFYDKQLRSHSQ